MGLEIFSAKIEAEFFYRRDTIAGQIKVLESRLPGANGETARLERELRTTKEAYRSLQEEFYKRNKGMLVEFSRRECRRNSEIDVDSLTSEADALFLRCFEGFNPNLGLRFSTYYVRSLIKLARDGSFSRTKKIKMREPGTTSYNPQLERVGQNKTPTPLQDMYASEKRAIIDSTLASFPPRERAVIIARYPILNPDPTTMEKETLEQIGEKYNLSRERVRQIEREGLDKLRLELKLRGYSF